jgi:hypothetical protein
MKDEIEKKIWDLEKLMLKMKLTNRIVFGG